MKSVLPFLLFAASLIISPGTGFAQTSSFAEEELGTVHLRGYSPCFDARVRRALDSLVPRLAALNSGRIVKIEASASWGDGPEERVRNSLLLALEAHRYLRAKFSSGLTLYMSAAPSRGGGEGPFIRVVSFPDSFSTVHVSTVGNRQP
ncbi:MAG: hypothetical protein EG828_14220 [Deltaproteobacteria bacterium]|nr:hypothetical protein [Deltaproteobacteria bacterium]